MIEQIAALDQANKLLEMVDALIAIADNINDLVEANPPDLQAQVAHQLNAAKLLTSDGEAEVLAERCPMLIDALVRIRGITCPRTHSFHAGPYTGSKQYDYQLIAANALTLAKPPVRLDNEPAVGVRYTASDKFVAPPPKKFNAVVYGSGGSTHTVTLPTAGGSAKK